MGTIQDRLVEKASRGRVPIMAAFELLPVCNLRCKMCYVRKSMAEVNRCGGLKDAEWWLRIAREAADLGLCYPLLTGGEPFLHPDFFEILERMEAMGLQPSINSNGTLITRDVARWLGKHRPTRINITLYGASAETYQDLCGDGSAFDRVHEGVELLKEYGVPVKFNCSVTPQNVRDLDQIMAYARQQKCPLQAATYMFPPLRRDCTQVGTNDRLSPEDAAAARVKLDYLQGDPGWFLGQVQRYRQFVPLDRLPDLCHPVPGHMTCRAGLCSFWIDWQGQMTNCGMNGTAFVRIDERPFAEAWEELVRKTAEVTYLTDCSVCPNRRLCHPCVAMIACECGKQEGRPYYVCRMNEKLSQYYQECADRCYPDWREHVHLPTGDREACER